MKEAGIIGVVGFGIFQVTAGSSSLKTSMTKNNQEEEPVKSYNLIYNTLFCWNHILSQSFS